MGARGSTNLLASQDLCLEVRLGFHRIRNQAVLFSLLKNGPGFCLIGARAYCEFRRYRKTGELRELVDLLERAFCCAGQARPVQASSARDGPERQHETARYCADK